MAYLPNKKVIFLIIFILLGFAGWFYYSQQKKENFEYVAIEGQKTPLIIATSTQNSIYEADTDGDGLKDWEEILWKTDPKKSDTDNDGTSDGEEVIAERDPLKAGPDDKIAAKIEDLVKENKETEKKETLTISYAKQFLANYLLLKQQKGTLAEDDKSSLVDSIMQNMEPLQVDDKYEISNLKFSSGNSDAAKKYGANMKKIFIEEKQDVVDDALVFELLINNLKNNEPYDGNIRDLKQSITTYDKLISEMLLLQIPNNVSQSHLKALNSLSNVKYALENMILAPTDPIRAVMGRKLYDEEIQKTYDALSGIQSFLDKYDVYIF